MIFTTENTEHMEKIRVELALLVSGVPLVGNAVDCGGAVDPLFFVFPEEAVAAHDEPFDEAVAPHGEEHVAGACGAEVASGAVDGGNDILVEEDDIFGGFCCEATFFGK